MGIIELEIDASPCLELIERLERGLSPQAFDNAMAGVMRKTGKHVKKVLGDDIPRDYNVTKTEVRSETGAPTVTSGGGGAGCCVPVRGPRRHIGGTGTKHYPAWSKKVHGWDALHVGHYGISTRIYRGATVRLPGTMGTGAPPFRNIPSSLNMITFARTSPAFRTTIDPVMGPAIPQMPLNKSEPAVQADIASYLYKEVGHRVQGMIANGG